MFRRNGAALFENLTIFYSTRAFEHYALSIIAATFKGMERLAIKWTLASKGLPRGLLMGPIETTN